MKKTGKALLAMALLSVTVLGGVASAATISKTTWPSVKAGSSGGFVSALQADLWSSGYQNTVGTVDGSFGSGTTSAVKSFQTAEGLTSDGVVGNGTWSKLDNYMVYNTANSRFYRNSGSTTYQTYYLMLADGSRTILNYFLEYRSNRNTVKSGTVFSE
ncbi:peptidoglycan-binding protein [Paenibacillus sp. OK060]|uniref:peptidoglycan-binding domain-containing protein n=1 Tax=Paenibacillus sp. OK060 TaxID=1881034 RepID=UPI00210A528C|nr:peptidoglycan-binding domain-containing protein [Paenibacillus sp. OK060]